MTTVNYLSKSAMKKRTGMNALGYSDPKNDEILILKGLPKKTEMKVREHESEHMMKGEEGPLLPIVGAAVAGSLLSGILGAKSADRAADAEVNASNAAIAEQRRQYDQSREDLAPYRTIGTQALNALGSIYGYSPYTPQNPQQTQVTGELSPLEEVAIRYMQNPSIDPSTYGGRLGGSFAKLYKDVYDRALAEGKIQPIDFNGLGTTFASGQQPPQTPTQGMAGPDYSQFFASPDYEFRRTEGMRDIGNSFAARGGAASGNALRALSQYNSNLAAGEFGNYFNRQAALAGVGQAATNQGVAAGQNTAANIGNLLGQAGSARASGILGRNAAWTNALGSGIDAWYNRGGPATPPFDNSQVGPWGW